MSKRKGLGTFLALSAVGIVCLGVVGGLSKGFREWDTRKWFEHGTTMDSSTPSTEEPRVESELAFNDCYHSSIGVYHDGKLLNENKDSSDGKFATLYVGDEITVEVEYYDGYHEGTFDVSGASLKEGTSNVYVIEDTFVVIQIEGNPPDVSSGVNTYLGTARLSSTKKEIASVVGDLEGYVATTYTIPACEAGTRFDIMNKSSTEGFFLAKRQTRDVVVMAYYDGGGLVNLTYDTEYGSNTIDVFGYGYVVIRATNDTDKEIRPYHHFTINQKLDKEIKLTFVCFDMGSDSEGHTVVLDASGGLVKGAQIIDFGTIAYGDAYDLPVPILDGCTFNGWNEQADETKFVALSGTWMYSEDVYLVANWKELAS